MNNNPEKCRICNNPADVRVTINEKYARLFNLPPEVEEEIKSLPLCERHAVELINIKPL